MYLASCHPSGTYKLEAALRFLENFWICILNSHFSFPVTQQPSSHLGRLILRFLDDTVRHTHTHTPGTSPLNGRSACRRALYLHNTQKRRTCMPSAGLEPASPEIDRLQNCKATEVGSPIHLVSHNPANVFSAGDWTKFG
jgi:hypothetical protein